MDWMTPTGHQQSPDPVSAPESQFDNWYGEPGMTRHGEWFWLYDDGCYYFATETLRLADANGSPVGWAMLWRDIESEELNSTDDRPAVVEIDDTDKILTLQWYRLGQLHRDNGPAVEKCDGAREWYSNGVLKDSL